MIVCHCNVITANDIEAVIEELLTQNPYRLLTPGLLYKQLGKSGKCCGCFPNVSQMIARANERASANNQVMAERHRQSQVADFSRFVTKVERKQA